MSKIKCVFLEYRILEDERLIQMRKMDNSTVSPGGCSDGGEENEKQSKSVSEQMLTELERRDLLVTQLALCRNKTERSL